MIQNLPQFNYLKLFVLMSVFLFSVLSIINKSQFDFLFSHPETSSKIKTTHFFSFRMKRKTEAFFLAFFIVFPFQAKFELLKIDKIKHFLFNLFVLTDRNPKKLIPQKIPSKSNFHLM